MGWSLGFDNNWKRWIGYGVPAYCDHSDCNEEIDRGLSYVCGEDLYGGENGCGLYFCGEHLAIYEKDNNAYSLCERCGIVFEDDSKELIFFEKKLEHPDWINHFLTHESWEEWRIENLYIYIDEVMKC